MATRLKFISRLLLFVLLVIHFIFVFVFFFVYFVTFVSFRVKFSSKWDKIRITLSIEIQQKTQKDNFIKHEQNVFGSPARRMSNVKIKFMEMKTTIHTCMIAWYHMSPASACAHI